MNAIERSRNAVGLALVAVSVLSVVAGVTDLVAGQRGWQGGNGSQAGSTQNLIGAIPAQDLSATERATLLFMREEEKLARDVYRTMFAKWGVRVFANIAVSEERHTNAIKALLERYSVADPVKDDSPGVFSDPALGRLYGDLVAEGFTSIAAAYKVGAMIEDLDIRDLDAAIAGADNADLDAVYGNLRAGSENHLRAFAAQLAVLGEIYRPQYMTQSQLDDILAKPMGRGQACQGNGTCPGGRTSAGRSTRGSSGNPNPGVCPNTP